MVKFSENDRFFLLVNRKDKDEATTNVNPLPVLHGRSEILAVMGVSHDLLDLPHQYLVQLSVLSVESG